MSEPSSSWKATILVIEDDPNQVRLYEKSLPQFRVLAVDTGTAALEILQLEFPDVIILDHQLANGEKGTVFLPLLKAELAHIPIVLVSGTLDIQGQLKALQGPYSAHYLIEKPVDLGVLRETIAHALEDCGLAETVRCIRSLERAELLNSKDPERVIAFRLARQVELLKRLRDGQRANVSHLALELKVSRRTIARDIHDLILRGQLPGSVMEARE